MRESGKMNWQIITYYFSFLSRMFTTLIALCTVVVLLCLTLSMALWALIQRRTRHQANAGTVAFFHPYCNAGGGGERVLWCAVRALQNKYSDIKIVVFTGDVDARPEDILARVRQRFNVHLPRDVQFVYLTCRKWVEASTYPHFTLLCQSVGSMLLGLEALLKCVPEVYLDSMGYAFTLPLFKYIGGCRVGCYVHYPTVSTDMVQNVSSQTVAHNNASFIGRSKIFSSVKVLYYQMFAVLYGLAGSSADVVMVNSSWTQQHILQLWKRPATTFTIYPPCDVLEFQTIPLTEEPNSHKSRHLFVVSVSQFRPEKDHKLQIRAFRNLLDLVSESVRDCLRLQLIGSCRHKDDEDRVLDLKRQATELGVDDKVDFLLNVSFEELKSHLQSATIGLHTMWNEHFGIGVVECMAAGLIVLAHNSGGPKMDIVVDYEGRRTGYLASNEHDFAATMETILSMSEEEKYTIRANARNSTVRFSDNVFETSFLNLFETFCLTSLT